MSKPLASSDRPSWVGGVVALLVGLVLLAAIAELGLRLFMPHWQDFFSGRFMRVIQVPDHTQLALGRPGYDGWFAQNNGDFRTRIRINEHGLRNDEPVAAADQRLWVLGDSMTFAWGVERQEAYTQVIADQAGIPTYNVAAPGANVCGYQALLYRMPKETRPLGVVVGVVLENDVLPYDCREDAIRSAKTPILDIDTLDGGLSLMQVKLFLTHHSALYNVLAVSLKRVGGLHDLLVKTGIVNVEHGYKRFYADDQVERVSRDTSNELAKLRDYLPTGTPLAVALIPSRFELIDGDKVYHDTRQAMIRDLNARGIAVIDLFDDFHKAGFAGTHFIHDGHWNAAGHQVAGKAIAQWMKMSPEMRGVFQQ